MPDETYLNPLPSDMQSEELDEISGSGGHALPSRQFCVFRAGRERFCLPVLEVEEVVDWPLVTRRRS
jgi:chemotaxis signal transduction protein